MRIAVAIPTYNREKVLVETIEQVLAQDPPADEIIVVDQTIDHSQATIAFLAEAEQLGKLRWIKHHPPNLMALVIGHCRKLPVT